MDAGSDTSKWLGHKLIDTQTGFSQAFRSNEPPHVLVVGAGPVGLAMATELYRQGISCRVIDRAAGPSTKSKAVSLHSRTLEIFESMGMIEGALARGRRLTGLSWHSGTRRVAHISFEGMDSPYSFELGIAQSDTEQVLDEHLRGFGLRVERGVCFESVEQDANGVTVMLCHANGMREVFRTKWLIACDGAGSAVREALGFAFKGRTYEEEGLHADVQLTWPDSFKPPPDQNLFFLGPPGFMAALPLASDGHYRLVFLLRPGEGTSRDATLANLQAQAELRGPNGIIVHDPVWIDRFRMHCRMVDRYRDGRVFLAGDAAHVHSPFGGQGISLGIQDAYNLGWKLALVIRGAAHSELLDSYETERRPLAAKTLRGTHLTMLSVRALSTFRNPWVRTLRDRVVSFVTSRPQVKRNAGPSLGMLTVNYRNSRICVEHWSAPGGPAAGDRALLPKGIAHCPKHVLLLFTTGNQTTLADEVRQRYGTLVETVLVLPSAKCPSALSQVPHSVVLDSDLALHRRYGARSECLYLIRPDGYVGYRSLPAHGGKLHGYLRRIFLN